MGAKAAIIRVCMWHMSSMYIQGWWEKKHADKDVRDKQGPTETTPCRSTLQEPLLTQSAAMANDKNTHTQV